MMPGLPLPAKEDCKPSALRSLPMLMMVMTLGSRMVMMVMGRLEPGKSQNQVQILSVSGFGPMLLMVMPCHQG